MAFQLTDYLSLNRGGTPGSPSSGTYYVETVTSLAALLLASPSLTGTPTAPTAAANTNTTQIATTAFVTSAVSAVAGGMVYQTSWNASTNTPALPTAAPGNKGYYYVVSVAGTTSQGGITDWEVGDWVVSNGTTWEKIDNSDKVTSVAGKSGVVTLVVADVTGAAPLASPALTGTPTATTATVDTNTTQIATTAFVLGQAGSATPLIDGAAAVGTATRYAREDHVHPTDTTRAPLASPTFTGTPAAPTATAGTNTTQVATTAFVTAAIAAAPLAWMSASLAP